MPLQVAPLTFKPPRLKGLSQTLIDSHYENNYGQAVRTFNAIESTRQILKLFSVNVRNLRARDGLSRDAHVVPQFSHCRRV